MGITGERRDYWVSKPGRSGKWWHNQMNKDYGQSSGRYSLANKISVIFQNQMPEVEYLKQRTKAGWVSSCRQIIFLVDILALGSTILS